MNKYDNFYSILEQEYDLYNNFIEIEELKYETIIKDDVDTLDKIVEKEQAFFLKSKGLENKRMQIVKELELKGKSLLDTINYLPVNEKERFKILHKNIINVLDEFKFKNAQCQELAQIRLHRVKHILNELNSKNQNNKNYFKDSSSGEIDLNRTSILTKKI